MILKHASPMSIFYVHIIKRSIGIAPTFLNLDSYKKGRNPSYPAFYWEGLNKYGKGNPCNHSLKGLIGLDNDF